ncbi:hypothetical protein MJH12_10330, partial [bacterium]|nr:hypothetical protein [bacterium]
MCSEALLSNYLHFWELFNPQIPQNIHEKMKFDISKINIPSHPGIYLMKDAKDSIIYIGKAK